MAHFRGKIKVGIDHGKNMYSIATKDISRNINGNVISK